MKCYRLHRPLVAIVLTASLPAHAQVTTLASFGGANGANPYAGLVSDGAGNLFGTTAYGGTSNGGSVFRLDTSTNTLTTLANFDGFNGKLPFAGLAADGNGSLFGTTYQGGAFNRGTVFRLDTFTNTLTTLVNFDRSNGEAPFAGLISDGAGNLLGTTSSGGTFNRGTVFRLDTSTGALTTLVNFNGTNGYLSFGGSLVIDGSGNLFGVTGSGGAFGEGTLFRLDMATNTLITLVNFNGVNGSAPRGLLADGAGNLFGTTMTGGEFNRGTVFRLNTATNTFTTVKSFRGWDGYQPSGSLIADGTGNLFGTTNEGGTFDQGTVFRLDMSTSAFRRLVNFNGENGAYPAYAGLVADNAGNLFGTTYSGGAFDMGTVFRLQGASTVVPEPATWLTMIVGFGAAGCMLRRHRGRLAGRRPD